MDVSGIDPLFAVEIKGAISERILANFRNEADLSSEPGTANRLVRSLSSEVYAISGSKQSFPSSRQTLSLHGQSRGVASDNSDARNVQCQSLFEGIRIGSLPQ